ncbi:YaaC family protein [Ornithinibacillus sp. BX22]|uniref:YaaC family protein n=1 Tax=Ornithinibacillus hominis TaxID=2763055 RepID=A0A923RLR0_9BACI|nr:YaaC family protein [Ornithinibacillus hominis]MBC5638362.1 YaaC family protein [Ornithinibacillus hominis]
MRFSEDIQSFYTYLQSQQTAQKYLYHCYLQLEDVDAERKSYENCNVFMYCLNHGKEYYRAGEQLDLVLKPVMFFYGMAHLLKACLLTKRPDYPESTSVLAHGVSARKRKKKDYSFLEDEVKLQHKGLFPYFSQHLFGIKQLPFEKITMRSLFSLIPELITYFALEQDQSLIPIGKRGDRLIRIPKEVCDHYHMTENALIKRMKDYLSFQESQIDSESITIHLTDTLIQTVSPFQMDLDGMIYLPTDRQLFFPLSEIMVHYLLLYNLSMLSRYEAEWWGELLATKPDADYPFISSFLTITQKKIPLLIGEYLHKKIEGQ